MRRLSGWERFERNDGGDGIRRHDPTKKKEKERERKKDREQ